jgi:hypothetical protein
MWPVHFCCIKIINMTNVLIPTDFTVAGFTMAAQAVKTLNRRVNIILFHAFEMPFYYQDTIRTEKQPWHELMNDEWRQACKQLKETYPWLINSISFRFMQGDTAPLFRNWLEANDVHLIVAPAHYQYTKVHPRSVNPLPLFKKSRLPLLQDLKTVTPTIIERNRKADMPSLSTAS